MKLELDKKHYIGMGIGVAILLVIYFSLSCKGCGGFTARLKQGKSPDEVADVTHENKEL